MTRRADLEHMLAVAQREYECAKYIDNTARRNREVDRYAALIKQYKAELASLTPANDNNWKSHAASILLPFSISVMGGWLFANLFMQ